MRVQHFPYLRPHDHRLVPAHKLCECALVPPGRGTCAPAARSTPRRRRAEKGPPDCRSISSSVSCLLLPCGERAHMFFFRIFFGFRVGVAMMPGSSPRWTCKLHLPVESTLRSVFATRSTSHCPSASALAIAPSSATILPSAPRSSSPGRTLASERPGFNETIYKAVQTLDAYRETEGARIKKFEHTELSADAADARDFACRRPSIQRRCHQRPDCLSRQEDISVPKTGIDLRRASCRTRKAGHDVPQRLHS